MNSMIELEEFLNSANNLIAGNWNTPTGKNKRALALLGVTLDHSLGFRVLVNKNLLNPATALVRTCYETLLRAIWLKNCANDVEALKFLNEDKIGCVAKNGKWQKCYTEDLAKKVEDCMQTNGAFVKIHPEMWNAFCSYTHGGRLLIDRNLSKNIVGQQFSTEDLKAFSSFIYFFSAIALLQIGEILNQGRIMKEINDLIEKYWQI